MPLPLCGTPFRAVLLAFWLLAGLGILGGCDRFQDESGPSGEPVSYEWVTRGHGVDVYEAQTRVFRDSLAWAQFWNKHVMVRDENFELYPPPSIEFNRRIIIGVYWGYFYGGCRVTHRIKAIEDIHDAGDRIVVSIGPVPDLGVCRTMVLPTQVVTIPRPNKPVEFTGKVPEQRYEPPPDQRLNELGPSLNKRTPRTPGALF